MTYAAGGLIQASDLDTLVSSGTPNLNNIWSTGAGNSGYGQTALSIVSAGGTVTAAQWAALINTIATVANHQATSVTTVSAPSVGSTISYIAAIPTNLGLINTSRLNAAASGSTTTNVATSAITWSDRLTMTFTVAFANNNAARYFFNAGGHLGLSFSHPSSVNINVIVQDICNEFGTMWLSSPISGTVSIAGTNYNGITKTGGVVSSRGQANTNNGFYALTGTASQCYNQVADASYGSYSSTNLNITAAYNSAGTITFTCVFDEVPNGAVVAVGTTGTLTVRYPSTTYLANTWGTPTLSNSVTGS
jgi:hypothetical protein